MLKPQSPIEKVPRIGKRYAEKLARLNIKTIEDFLMHFPFRYEDYSERVPIENLRKGETATVMGWITSCKLVRTWKKRMMIFECVLEDETGEISAVWFNQPYISDTLLEGKGVRISGKLSQNKNGQLYFSNPAWELSTREPTNTGRLVPIYPETEGITSKWIRWQLSNIFKLQLEIIDPIPQQILSELHLPDLETALKFIHFPQTQNQYLLAQKRFAFQNMLTVQLASLQIKNLWEKESAVKISKSDFLDKFKKNLPFELTNAQQKAIEEISNDLVKSRPMNRLLNGDVGSGKTIIAAAAMAMAADAKFQATLMAPTEVLAKQHYMSFCNFFKHSNINIALLTNAYKLVSNSEFRISNFESNLNNESLKTKTLKIQSKFKIKNSKLKSEKISRDELLSAIRTGEIDIIIGTHALIQKDIKFKNLALVIVDEQHRFGVDQRAFLQQQAVKINDGLPNQIPHFLTMTATPIPRTLTLAFFGNLDLSVLDEMPKNRKPIITNVVPPSKRNETYDFISKEIQAGHQAFVILPLVEESEKLTELKAATEEHARLSKDVFPELSLGLLHGRMKASEKEAVMADFKAKKYDILVATSVVEVGIDVPNATVIIIEDADRFGLSQLHQFRGRVGRSQLQSYCFLFASSNTEKSKSRLKAMEKSTNGFEIAEHDLKLRGPGEFLGTRQSGLPDIAMQHIANVKLIEISRAKAQQLLLEDPELNRHPLLKQQLSRFSKTIHLE